MIAKLEWAQSNAQKKHRTITESHNGSNNEQRIDNRTTAFEWTAAKATGDLNAFYCFQGL